MTKLSAPIALAGGFEPPNYETWRKLVEKALHGADFDRKLVMRTADGLQINPLYTRADALAAAQAAMPGAAPFTRGTKPRSAGLGWHIHQRVVAPDADSANAVILEELEGGASGVVLQIAAPGQTGIAIAGASDMAAALAGVYLDYASVQLLGGVGSIGVARNFLGALELLKSKPGEAASFPNVDPIGTSARFGTAGTPIMQALGDAVKLANEARASGANVVALTVDATVPHEAGASEAQELAYLAATLTAYLRAFEAASISPSDAFSQIAFALAVDTDLFLGAAKVRAARTIIARIVDACKAMAGTMHITAVTSQRMMAKRDPWTNMLRTTAACAAAAFGGADAVTVLPFTWALGAPDRFARRVARNAQLVLQEESLLGRVADPVGGSWYVEKLTAELAEKAWALFQDIEAKGGIVAALVSGALADDIARVAQARARAISTGRLELTGVSVFPLLGEDGVKVVPLPKQTPLTAKTEVRPLTPYRLAEPFEDLRDRADAYAAKGARARVFLANLGEIAEHNRRSTWAWNLLAAGGIEGLTSDGYKDAAEAATAFKKSGSRIACICSSDAVYAAQAKDTAKALKAAGASRVLLAGKPGEDETGLRAAGVDGFLQAGQDAIAALKELQKSLGIA
jgi:methylmalonyl-CoA mutase